MNSSIDWFVRNKVAANLLMWLILIGGAVNIFQLGKEMFPPFKPNNIQVTVSYPGAGPKEVEQQICVPIEEVVFNLDGVKRVNSTARQSFCRVIVEADSGYDLTKLGNEIKSRVDSIRTFPRDAERPLVSEQLFRPEVIRVAVAGDVGEDVLRVWGQKIRDDLAALPDIDTVELFGVRDPIIAVEVSEISLRRYGLNFDAVVNAIRTSSIDLPAGVIRSGSGDIQIQTKGQGYYAADFLNVVVASRPDGSQVLLRDVAEVKDDFEDVNAWTRFNGKRSVFMQGFVGKNPDILKATEQVRQYVETSRKTLPEGLEIGTWLDLSYMFDDRLSMLSWNAVQGLVLVFAVLMLFLRPKLAMWVAAGIGVAYIGTLWLLPVIGLTINMISMFCFLMILGIVVDDAIIVGESIYSHQQKGMLGAEGASAGAQAVSKPVLFAVLSTNLVFVPMFFLPGPAADLMWAVPAVAIIALTFSLIETYWILPSHLAGMKPERVPSGGVALRFHNFRHRFADGLERFTHATYKPFLERCLHWRGLTMTGFFLAFALSIVLLSAGYVKQESFPNPPADFIIMHVNMPEGFAFQGMQDTARAIEAAGDKLLTDPEVQAITDTSTLVKNNLIFIFGSEIYGVVELQRGKSAEVDPGFLGDRWKYHLGEIRLAENLEVSSTVGGGEGSDVTFQLASNDPVQLSAAAKALEEALRSYPGVHNIRDSQSSGRYDIDIALKPFAENLDIDLAQVARQVRQGFYGEEAQRIPRGKDEVRVMVRYPDTERDSVANLEQMRIRTQDGAEVPFSAVAEAEYVPGVTRISRRDRSRSVAVYADVNTDKMSSSAVIQAIFEDKMPQILQQYPSVTAQMGGTNQEDQEFIDSLFRFFGLSMALIYILMAVEFRSYLKPFGILVAVPFGIMGAIFGHLLMGFNFTIVSFFGILAASGVVVNDNLVLIDRVNQLRREGMPVYESLVQAATDRFRPILLTSLTTFIGLFPILLEKSMQARFLIPMVNSLAFGVLFATFVTLLFVPCLYLSAARVRDRLRARRERRREARQSAVAH